MRTGPARWLRGAVSRSHATAALLLAALACAGAAVFPAPAIAAAIVTPAGYNTNLVARADDTSNLVVNLPFSMTWAGTIYTQLYLNMNGNVTFGNTFTNYDPNPALGTMNRAIMAPFWADVDTRNTATAQMTYSNITSGSVPTVGGRKALFVNWINVARYSQTTTPLNSFQLVLIDRSDTGAGNFDFEFNYDTINWDFPTSQSTGYARAGWARTDGTAYELPGGDTSGRLLDTGANALVDGTLNSGGVLGRYVWQVRNGTPANSPPVITLGFTTTTLRANTGGATPGYAGYSGAGDATAADPDGSVVSFVRSPAAGTFLPMGSTTVTWTATDNDGAVTTASQTIVVVDDTPPTLPTLSSPTHNLSTWYRIGTIGIDWSGATDSETGVDGYSYSWTANAPGLPDTTEDTYTPGVPINVTLEDQSFPTNVWPGGWAPGGATGYLRANNAVGRNHGTSAAEVYAGSNTRRTAWFSKTYDLSGYNSASLSFYDYTTGIEAGDFNTVEYTTDGTSWINLQTIVDPVDWTQRIYDIPTGSSTVTIRFTGSVNRNLTEFVDWDDILLTAVGTTPDSISDDPGDGRWYFNIRAVDGVGNWTATAASIGPFWIDRIGPVTTSNAPTAWQSSTATVTLSATDLSGVVGTRYKLDASAVATYTVPIPVSGNGTHTLLFWSLDVAGNVEATNTATIRIDNAPPTAPTGVSASAIDTGSIEVTWTVSTDVGAGVAYYRIEQDGLLVGTTTVASFTATGLTAGQTYAYHVWAVDVVGNVSAPSLPASATTPLAMLWLDVSSPSVTFGGLYPAVPMTIPNATTVSVSGFGNFGYDLFCSAADFSNVDTASPTPTMPVSTLSFSTSGWKTYSARSFTNAPLLVDASTGALHQWRRDYTFDYTMTIPWTSDPSTYTTSIVYTAIAH